MAAKTRKGGLKRRLNRAQEFDQFCDAYQKNPMTVLALANGEDSITGKRLERYLKEAHSKPLLKEKVPSTLPFELDTLLSLQSSEGRWEDLVSVRALVEVDCPLGEDYSAWEEATALALAYLRQRSEFFEQIEPFYLKGCSCIDARLISRAVRLLLEPYDFNSCPIMDEMEITLSTKELMKDNSTSGLPSEFKERSESLLPHSNLSICSSSIEELEGCRIPEVRTWSSYILYCDY